MRWALVAAIALELTSHVFAEKRMRAMHPDARVRPMQERVARLLATGMDRSATFRQLVRGIEASDVIAYVEARHTVREGTGASMRFVVRSATDRFVRIQLNAKLNDHILVALLGHELQHVVEVAEHPEVQSADDLRRFYQRIGVRPGPDSFDSIAAQQAGYLVRDELLRAPGDLRLARGAASADLRLLDAGSFGADADEPPVSH